MSTINLDDIANIPDELIINGKTFLIKELKIVEKMEAFKIIAEGLKAIESINSYESLVKHLSTRDIHDYNFFKFVFVKSGSAQTFTLDDFGTIDNTKLAVLKKAVDRQNHFFDKLESILLKKETPLT